MYVSGGVCVIESVCVSVSESVSVCVCDSERECECTCCSELSLLRHATECF